MSWRGMKWELLLLVIVLAPVAVLQWKLFSHWSAIVLVVVILAVAWFDWWTRPRPW